jgi:hypothetical protein
MTRKVPPPMATGTAVSGVGEIPPRKPITRTPEYSVEKI